MVRCALLILGLAGCSNLLGIGDLEGPPDGSVTPPPDDGSVVPVTSCKAQRAVHLVAGTGGLAWFTLIWPAPDVINLYQPNFAYDDPARAKNLTLELSHQLFARTTSNGIGLWEGRGAEPLPSAFIVGSNETHTSMPTSAITSGGSNLMPAAAVLQVSLVAPIPVLGFGAVPYGSAPGAPLARVFPDVEPALVELQMEGVIDAQTAAALRPSSTQLASYFSAGAPAPVVALGTRLAFTANAFKLGLIGSVIMPAMNDDPHGAFATQGVATTRADQLAKVLDAFYADLATANELGCGDDGSFLSLADNTVLIVTGDTPKNSYDNAGWPDGTAGNSNLMYLRSNGFTKFGWFGELQPGGIRLFFDPATGLSGTGDSASDTRAAFAGALYSIARGDRTLIAPFTMGTVFDGVIKP